MGPAGHPQAWPGGAAQSALSGCGVGMRFAHQDAFEAGLPQVPWVEVHAENYMGTGRPVASLEAVRAHYPVSIHSVGLSLGSARRFDQEHLLRLVELVRRIEPSLVSDHLSWSASDGVALPDLLPLPMTEEALDAVCANVDRVQDALGLQILVENPSSYFTYRHSTLGEPEFLAALAARTGCGILCDVNNVFVSCANHGWDATAYLRGLPGASVREIHLAGHSTRMVAGCRLRVDDHGAPVSEAVWDLYAEALRLYGPVPTLIERDNALPPLHELLGEARYADELVHQWQATQMLATQIVRGFDAAAS